MVPLNGGVGDRMKADLELVQDVKEGKREAFSELVRRHQRQLLRVCLRFTHDVEIAEEVVQDAFIKAYEKIHLFEGRSSFKSWLFQIAINTAKNVLRANRMDLVNLDTVQLSTGPIAESGLVKRDVQATVQREVDNLPQKQRMAVVLRIYEDLSFKEIAQIMDCPYDTAKANFRHGLLKIKEALETDTSMKSWLATQMNEEYATYDLSQEAET